MTNIGLISKSDMLELVNEAIEDIEEMRKEYRKLPPRASVIDSMYRKGKGDGAKDAQKRLEQLRQMLEVY